MKNTDIATVIVTIFTLYIPSTMIEAKSNENVIGINLEAGSNGNYGLLGLEANYFPSQRVDIHGGLGVSAVATLAGAGARIYTDASECFLSKHCSEKYYLGANISQTLSKEVVVTGDDNISRKYKVPQTTFINAAVGSSTVFFDRLNFMLNIGYKFATQRHEPKLISGPGDSRGSETMNSSLKSGTQVSVAAGFLF